VDEPESAATPAPVATKGPTIRGEVLASLAERYGVAADELRATFEATDAEFLATPTSGARIVVSPASSTDAARAVVQVRVVQGSSIKASRAIRADIELLRDVLVLRTPLKKHEAITAGVFDSERRWVAPSSGDVIASLDGLEGSLARTRVAVGTVLRREHLESPIIVKRNELVTIYTVSNGFEIRTKARARVDARIGDVLEFRSEGSKRSFMARIDGPGVAVAEMEAQPTSGAERRAKEESR
jgi:flagella basal body P-ring formation protein FlgA